MAVAEIMTTQLRACEEMLLNLKEYKKGELCDLYRMAKEAIQSLKAEQDAIESALPQLADNERKCALERQTQMTSMELSAETVQMKLEQLHAHSGELCAILEPQTTRLQHLQTKIQYYELLLEVETLSAQAKTSANSNGDIDAFVALAALNQSLSSHFGLDSSLQLNLRSLIKQRMAYLAVEFQIFHTNAFDAALQDLNWPQYLVEADFVSQEAQLTAFRRKFTTLVQVQLALASVSPEGVEAEMSELWVMHRLLQPLVRRFHFHFNTDVKTNDVAKPEWYLMHVLELLRGHAEFLHAVVRPALAEGLTSSQNPSPTKPDGLALFIHGLLQPVRAKLKQTMPILLLNKALLCHTIDEVVEFEWTLRDEFNYRPPRVLNQKYRHVLDEVSSNPSALDLWLQIDLEYAQTAMLTYLREDVAWTYVSDDDKVTNAAYAITATLDALTRRFQFLTDPTHRYTYVAQVVKPWLYQCHLAVERYGWTHQISQTLVVGATLTNKVPTALRGYGAAINTAWFVQQLLKELDETKVFVELLPIAKVTLHQPSSVPLKLKQKVVGLSKTVLNPLLQTQEAKNVTHALLGQGSLVLPTAAFSAAYSVGSTLFRSLHGPTSISTTSPDPASVDTDDTGSDEGDDAYTLEGSMFQNESTWFQGGVQSLEDALVQASIAAIRTQLGQYKDSPRWTEPRDVDRMEHDVSPELGGALELLQKHLVRSAPSFPSIPLPSIVPRLSRMPR
ncbi:hypothetical protein, variant 1 [Aphanomyces invadans]|uniref:Uncharacterized protein n=1 Tax=Aphanomyces invadans TaxID=157072 RepID=A0A024UUX2_9STRA|nr:hypothetical protein, variant 1 [Aphanomyces invadans]ETW09732.1 hypothetical protein, variant 1 [Aphanomyces invadans]|eukprot:XP_008861143.1 hypothetical protein, variant 1 [Aphanomyces invadans]